MSGRSILRVVAIAVLLATTLSPRISHAGSWSTSLRVAGGNVKGEYDETRYRLGLNAHVVREGWVRPGIEGAWWEQVGHVGGFSCDGGRSGAEPCPDVDVQAREFLLGGILQITPDPAAPIYLVVGFGDLVAIRKQEYGYGASSELSHAPAFSGGVGAAAKDGFGPVAELRWHLRLGADVGTDLYFLASAGVRF